MVDERHVREAFEHFNRLDAALNVARSIAGRVKEDQQVDLQGRAEREAFAARMIAASKALREGGQLTLPEFIQHAGFFAISIVHEKRWLEGDYEADLAEVNDRMDAIQLAHGLQRDEFWKLGEGPPEWEETNRIYESVLTAKKVEVLREFGLGELAAVLEGDPEEFERLWIRGLGLGVCDELLPRLERLELVLGALRKEAAAAERGGAFLASAALRGALLEGFLLRQCLSRPDDTQRALRSMSRRQRPTAPPERWTLGQLIQVSEAAGWLDDVVVEGESVSVFDLAETIASNRNLLHPGRQLASPKAWLGEREMDHARALCVLIEIVLEELESGR